MSATVHGEEDRLTAVRAEARQRAEAGDLTGARTLLEDALAVGELRVGRDHPSLVQLMVDLATVARELGNLTEALNQLRRAYAIVSESSGRDDAAALAIEGRLAAISHRLGDPTEVLDWHLTDVGARVLGPEHAAVRGARRRLAAPRPAESPPEPAMDLPGSGGDLPYPSSGPYAGLGTDLAPVQPPAPGATSPFAPAPLEPALFAPAPAEPAPSNPAPYKPKPVSPYEPEPPSPYDPNAHSPYQPAPSAPASGGWSPYLPPAAFDPPDLSDLSDPTDPTDPPGASAYLPSSTFPGVYDRQPPVAGWQGGANDQPPSVTPPSVTSPPVGSEWRGSVDNRQPDNRQPAARARPAPVSHQTRPHDRRSAAHGRPLGDGIYMVDPPAGTHPEEYDEAAWEAPPLATYAPGVARPRRSHGGAALVVSLALAVLLAGGVVIYQTVRSSGHNFVPSGAIETTTAAADDPTPTAAPTATPTPAFAAPGPVAMLDNGGSVTLTWSDPSAGQTPFIVAGGRVGSPSRPLVTIPRGQQTSTIYGLNKSYNYCFTVTAVYSATVTAPSPQVCTARKLPGASPPGSPAANRPPMINGAPRATAEARGWAP